MCQSLLFLRKFLAFNSPPLFANSDLTLKLFATFEQQTKLHLKKMGDLYHQQRLEHVSDVSPDWCTTRAYRPCEVPPASEKAAFCPEALLQLPITVMRFCELIGFLFIYFKNCQTHVAFVCRHNFLGWESGLNIYSTKQFFQKEAVMQRTQIFKCPCYIHLPECLFYQYWGNRPFQGKGRRRNFWCILQGTFLRFENYSDIQSTSSSEGTQVLAGTFIHGTTHKKKP